MPSEVSIAGAGHDREPTVEELKRELAAAREQQAATAETLKVISSSPMDLKRVFAEIAMSAARLCDAYDATIWQVFGDDLRLAAHHGQIPFGGPVGQDTVPLVRGLITGRAVIDRRTIHVEDMLAEGDEYPESRSRALQHGYRTVLSVPIVHAGEAIGVILIRRAEMRPFSDRQIDLLKTFADQAVIAIENTRLFEQVQTQTRQLSKALEQQTGTSEILRVIGRSPTDTQPVFDTIVQNARRLLNGYSAALTMRLGDELHVSAFTATGDVGDEALRKLPPHSLMSAPLYSDTVRDLVPYFVTDTETDERVEPLRAVIRLRGYRSILVVPMVQQGRAVGVIAITRRDPDPFSDDEIALIKTFADQAVIAIENARLFEAEQARTQEVMERTRELTEALEQQTATADVLKVISRSALDLQKVLDALVESAARLCNAYDAAIFQVFGDGLRPVAHHGEIPLAGPVGQHTRPLVRGAIAGRAVIDRRTIHVADMLAEGDEYPVSNALQQGYRTALSVPLVRAFYCP
jgi:GAF domain-containing protein